MRIWVDADACPREARTILIRASRRLQVPVTLVANRDLGVTQSELLQMVSEPVPETASLAGELVLSRAIVNVLLEMPAKIRRFSGVRRIVQPHVVFQEDRVPPGLVTEPFEHFQLVAIGIDFGRQERVPERRLRCRHRRECCENAPSVRQVNIYQERCQAIVPRRRCRRRERH